MKTQTVLCGGAPPARRLRRLIGRFAKGANANVGENFPVTRKAIVLIAASLAVSTASTAALAATKADREVRTLLQMMDKDKNGTVSKDEFMQFMSREFDRLDTDKTGQLESKHLRPVRNPSWPLGGCARVAFPQCSGGE
jgi:EF hand